jgi:hypothetical protein
MTQTPEIIHPAAARIAERIESARENALHSLLHAGTLRERAERIEKDTPAKLEEITLRMSGDLLELATNEDVPPRDILSAALALYPQQGWFGEELDKTVVLRNFDLLQAGTPVIHGNKSTPRYIGQIVTGKRPSTYVKPCQEREGLPKATIRFIAKEIHNLPEGRQGFGAPEVIELSARDLAGLTVGSTAIQAYLDSQPGPNPNGASAFARQISILRLENLKSLATNIAIDTDEPFSMEGIDQTIEAYRTAPNRAPSPVGQGPRERRKIEQIEGGVNLN